jgi:hypothetical protein
MKKVTLFILFCTLFLMYDCKDGGRSDKYGNSEDNSNTNYNTNNNAPNQSNADSQAAHPAKVNYTANARPEPDSSSFYENSKKRK